jgi:hypothetical protein
LAIDRDGINRRSSHPSSRRSVRASAGGKAPSFFTWVALVPLRVVQHGRVGPLSLAGRAFPTRGYGARARTVLLVWFIGRDCRIRTPFPTRRPLAISAIEPSCKRPGYGFPTSLPSHLTSTREAPLRAPAAFAKRLNGWRGSAAFSPSAVKIRVRQRPGPLKKG